MNMEDKSSSPSTNNVMRIYIGGLGATVTTNDLTKTFSAPNLGTVISVEIIRTKARSFAFLDFVPCSDKGLAKLFSTYNGCKWKGGSLRLEKAKEHYLQQLRREWDEDSEVDSNFPKEDGDAVEDVLHTVKPRKLPDMDKMQLNIFFPRLRKVKAVPFKGTGKHKYSFQRVEPRALPAHFCDCEEHSGAQDVDKVCGRHDDTKTEEDSYHDITLQEDSYDDNDNENGEVNEQELTMMSSVMNKLFEREVFSEATRKCGSSTVTSKNVNAIGDLAAVEDHQPDHMSDEDNLIINIVGGSKNNASGLGNNLATSNQDLRLKELHNSKSRHQNLQKSKQKAAAAVGEKRKQLKGDEKWSVPDVAGRKIRRIMPSNKEEKANFSHSKGTQTSNISLGKNLSDGSENSAKPQTNVSDTINHKPGQVQKSEQQGPTTEVDNSTVEISNSAPTENPGIDFQSGSDILGKPHTPGEDVNTNSSVQIREPEVSAEGLSGSGKSTADKATKGASWLQKFSWTQLVKGSESSSFSISQILPQTNVDKQEIQQRTFIDFSRPNLTTHVLPRVQSETVTLDANENLSGNTFANNVGSFGNLQADPEKNKTDGQINEASTSSPSNKHSLAAKQARTNANETFAFVRTAASMKEFAKIKASLSGSLKKKGDKKDS